MRPFPIFWLLFVGLVNANQIKFVPKELNLNVDDTALVGYELSNFETNTITYEIRSLDVKIAEVKNEVLMVESKKMISGNVSVTGKFLGRTSIVCRNQQTNEDLTDKIPVVVTRKQRVIDTVFTVSVAILVSLIYVNFGCAVNWSEFKEILKKPIGPAIGFGGQFILMPLISFGLAHLLFPERVSMQLGLFFVGVSPGGGASNLWTLLLGGNINLSIIMTGVSTILAFVMMPLWIFTLGRLIFNSASLEIPYTQILSYVIGLLVPLGIGYLCQRYTPRIAEILKRIMKMFSAILLVFIIVFAIVTNLYLFELFSWKIILAGLSLPWIGYIIGFLGSLILRQSHEDRIAIAIEVGIQNTGIAIFLLRFTLTQPEADLSTVLPVSIAMLTPVPLMIAYVYKLIYNRCFSTPNESTRAETTSSEMTNLKNNT